MPVTPPKPSRPLLERAAVLAAILSALFLAFVWGVAAMKWKVFPYRLIHKIEAGFDALGKLEDESLPQHTIRSGVEATAPDPVQSFGAGPADQLILMTGGFDYRRDLCPTHGCIAMVMERDGTVLHTWEADPAAIFTPEMLAAFKGGATPERVYVQGVDLAPDGDLVVTFQGTNIFPYQVGVARLGWDGTVKWAKADSSHHWPTVDDRGEVLTPIARLGEKSGKIAGTRQEMKCTYGIVFQEGVQILAPDGTEIRRFWLDDLVQSSDRQGLAYSVRDDCDPYHVNGVDVVNAAMAARLSAFGVEEGDVVVSLRSSSSIIIMDREDGTIRRVLHGPMVAQHSPKVLPDGDILVFDNMGGHDTKVGTRILFLDPVTGGAKTVFPIDLEGPGGDLDSLEEGSVRASPDGRHILIAETLNGRIIEADAETGETLWIYSSISDIAPALADKGKKQDGPVWALMQTQGADYLSRADFDRFSAQ